MKLKKFATLLVVSLLQAVTAHADDGLASCYTKNLGVSPGEASTGLFVLIDQTIVLDIALKQMVANQVKPFLQPGNQFAVVVFSAYTQGKYTQVLTAGQLDNPIPAAKRDDVSKPLLTKFDQCSARQVTESQQMVGQALRAAFDGATSDMAKSDILGGMKDIAGKIRQSSAKEKVVLVVSDMLENSSVSSFYSGLAVRKIDPVKELQGVVDNKMLADFGNARIYVMGAGLLNEAAAGKNTYRDPKTMQALESFWRSYFEKSNGQLMAFGQPALLNPIK